MRVQKFVTEFDESKEVDGQRGWRMGKDEEVQRQLAYYLACLW